jgi:hypothetical protein
MNSATDQRGSGKMFSIFLVLAVLSGAVCYFLTRNASVQNVDQPVKKSTQDATTTSGVRTSLLLSKYVSRPDNRVDINRVEATDKGMAYEINALFSEGLSRGPELADSRTAANGPA